MKGENLARRVLVAPVPINVDSASNLASLNAAKITDLKQFSSRMSTPVSAGDLKVLKGNWSSLCPILYESTHVIMENKSKLLSNHGNNRSAPKDFAVYGIISETKKGKCLGKFTNDRNGETIQTFEIPNEHPNHINLTYSSLPKDAMCSASEKGSSCQFLPQPHRPSVLRAAYDNIDLPQSVYPAVPLN
ncbi:hypothetical protein KOW79_021243 [Hemibagrus wyckioides]|uniref:SUN domain-containing protein n=1 Tax=Hemibagrus wyckioides TaxID=337641 RepID=A0A9D3S9B4_9TELE|nr:hypothetical protein KOW79_021243 [Hemibagrus wyckioides]